MGTYALGNYDVGNLCHGSENTRRSLVCDANTATSRIVGTGLCAGFLAAAPGTCPPPAIAARRIPARTLSAYHGLVKEIQNAQRNFEKHSRLAHQSRAVLRLGMMLLSAGASAYRVKHSMQKLALALGVEDTHTTVTFTEITLTCYAGGTFRTETAEQRIMGTNAARIDELVSWVETLPPAILVEDANEQMDGFSAKPALYNRYLMVLMTGFACACFCFLNHGGIVECSAVFCAAAAGQFLRSGLMKRLWNQFGVWFLCGLLSCFIYVGLVTLELSLGWISGAHQAGVVSAILFLIPGFPMVTALLDLLRADFSAGVPRGIYVVILMFAAAATVWAVTTIVGWGTTGADGYHLVPWALLLARIAATFVASFGFAMLFQASPTACALAALNGAIINPARLTAQDAGVMPALACLLAALLAGLVAHAISRRTRHSRVSLSVPSVVVMIPGVTFFRAISNLVNGHTMEAAEAAIGVILVITAIGVGLAAARMLTDRTWRMEPPHSLVGPLGDSRATLTPEVLDHVRKMNDAAGAANYEAGAKNDGLAK